MINGDGYQGKTTDLWSCGIILFAMVSGQLPFEDEDLSVLYKKILSADYMMPDFISYEVQDLLSRILVPDPEERINIEEIKSHPWFNIEPYVPLE